jgi:hypothetical protein
LGEIWNRIRGVQSYTITGSSQPTFENAESTLKPEDWAPVVPLVVNPRLRGAKKAIVQPKIEDGDAVFQVEIPWGKNNRAFRAFLKTSPTQDEIKKFLAKN